VGGDASPPSPPLDPSLVFSVVILYSVDE